MNGRTFSQRMYEGIFHTPTSPHSRTDEDTSLTATSPLSVMYEDIFLTPTSPLSGVDEDIFLTPTSVSYTHLTLPTKLSV